MGPQAGLEVPWGLRGKWVSLTARGLGFSFPVWSTFISFLDFLSSTQDSASGSSGRCPL